MPYIKKTDRIKFDEVLANLPNFSNKGELEYVIFKMMKQYMSTREYRYTELHNVCYAAQHCCDEFRRRYLDNRENEAIENNGDVE